MKKLMLAACLMGYTLTGFTQKIQGVVADAQTRQPVAGASVTANGTTGIVCNDEGKFELILPKKDSVQLTISAVGYKTLSVWAAPRNGTLTMYLEPWGLLMQAVEVRALRASALAPFAKTNISKKEIEALNLGQDLPFLMHQTPSVVINSDAGNGIGYTGIRIRGTDATRINMTINGIPYNDAESQGLFFVNLPDLASSVSSIQIQRGVGTSSNGAGAFGASMNFSTNEVNPTAYGEINNSVGSFNSWKHTVKAGTGLLQDHFTLDARLSRISSDGYIDRASSNLHSFYLSAAYLAKKSSLRLNVFSGREKTYQAWYGVSESDLHTNRRVNYAGTERPGSPYDNETDNYQQDHYQLFFNHEFHSKLVFQTAIYMTNGRGYYEQYKATESYGKYGLPDFITGRDTLRETDLIRQLWLDNQLFGQIFSLQYRNNGNELTLGGGWNRYQGHHFGEITWAQAGIPEGYRWYDHHARKQEVSLYLKYQRQLREHLNIFTDLQYRDVNYKIDGFRNNPGIGINQHYPFLNPKAGITYTYNRKQWYLSYALARKEPNRDDFEAGKNQLPRAEELHDVEAGMEHKGAGNGWSLGVYYMRYRNQLVLTGQINDVGAYTRTNIPDSYRLGLELQGFAQWRPWLRVSGNLTLSRNRILDFTEYVDDYDAGGQQTLAYQNTALALSPDLTGSGTLQVTPFKNASVNLTGRYVSRQFLDNTSVKSRSLAPYYVQDLLMGYTIPGKRFREIQLLLQLNNLFNRMYSANGYTFSYRYQGQVNTENYYYPMAGMHAMFGVNIKL